MIWEDSFWFGASLGIMLGAALASLIVIMIERLLHIDSRRTKKIKDMTQGFREAAARADEARNELTGELDRERTMDVLAKEKHEKDNQHRVESWPSLRGVPATDVSDERDVMGR